MEGLKNRFLAGAEWAQKNWLALVIGMIALMLIFLCIVMFSWLCGYWSNALYGTRFELGSCWSGITVVLTGTASVAALAKAAWTKYATDSQYNSQPGAPVNRDAIVEKIRREVMEEKKGEHHG